MSIQMTSGRGFDSTLARRSEPVCLYDDTDGMAFGPVFADRAEAEAFLRWFEKKYGTITAPKADKWAADLWRAFLEEHAPEQCPYDDESAGEGFLVDRDGADGQAWTPLCDCQCHDRGRDRVEVLGGWAE